MLQRNCNNLIRNTVIFTSILCIYGLFSHKINWIDQVTVNIPAVTIRKHPFQKSPWIGSAYNEQLLKKIDRKGNWLKVRLSNNYEGWILDKIAKETLRKIMEDIFITEAKAEQDLPKEIQRPIFNLKVRMSSVNIRQGPGISYTWIGTVKKDDLLSAFEEKDGWYHCKTPDGKEGWIIDSSCKVVPIHSESAHSELRRIIINCEETHVRTGPIDNYPALGILKMDQEAGVYLDEGEWVYIRRTAEGIEGWIKRECIYDPEKHIDIIAWKEEALTITEKLSNYYDQKKKETRVYQDAGWYPSFSAFLREKDIAIEPLLDGWRLELSLSLRMISMETLFPLPLETVPISLSRSDRLFFMLLFQTLMENGAYKEVEIRLKGLEKEGGSLKWTMAESYTLSRLKIEGKDLDNLETHEFWGLLTHNKN